MKVRFGVGSAADGPHVQCWWCLKSGEGADYSHQTQVKTTIRAIEPAEPKSGGSTDATGAAAGAIFK